jgi:hypothetical protein
LVVPEVMIGALGKIQVLPRYNREGAVVPTSVMNVRRQRPRWIGTATP